MTSENIPRRALRSWPLLAVALLAWAVWRIIQSLRRKGLELIDSGIN